ncbi:peptidoglycan bridge formation glycyltransferase FemA/FemB family protein [Flavobacterium macrobrachii]|uniref:Peptidoglycan bridge formation glycyltransferase FemA/FemB family protein n=1 Tax=Flavobacterium macrobrachii TaxID=591204 RepID=A0ABS2CZ63_9FLAO|nr:peptidoglycan bridge formation glycyltransferase FemA/FemB family protein [Flavobacterium macrobrachii]MBM6499482.1 peptidoglycan bridge formation glycyltransferase FemA/FemB family protein [Flavobacterium macrobrachii]
MEIKIISSNDGEWLKKWDDFVINENISSHLMLSDWNKSFKSYGFDFEVAILLDDNSIIGGFAAVIAKAIFFKFYVVPFGPIVSGVSILHLNSLIENVKERAKKWDCCYCHVSLPFSKSSNKHVINYSERLDSLKNAYEGHEFKYVYSANGLNWKSVSEFQSEEELLNSFSTVVRRNIRSSLRKELKLVFAENEEDIKKGYDLCLLNAKQNGYVLRDWNSFGNTIVEMVQKNKAKFLLAINNDTIKGATLLVKAGNHYTYILGGSVKEKPDILVGHFLQYNGSKLAWLEKLDGYNISLGGSTSVVKFKNSYADEQIYYENSKYYWVLKPLYFKLYLFLEKNVKKNKRTISKILSMFRK